MGEAAKKQAEDERRAAEEARSAGEEASALAGEFVDIPGGTFQMGCSPNDSDCMSRERPVHTVSIKPFRMGKYEVTVGQFRQFVEATGHRTDAERGGNCGAAQRDGQWAKQAGLYWRNPGFPQSDRHPVVCVSWNDAQAYVQWLSRQGVGRYRLLSESEWEYAARAGGSARYSFGDSEGMLCQYGNVADRTIKHQFGWGAARAASCDDGALYTASVGGYRPNGFGLHDMHGNVLEWTEDCYHDSYAGAPSEGVAWTAGDCARRVLRGGSWPQPPEFVRSSFRNGTPADFREGTLGFRLLQDPTEALPTPTTLPSVGGQPPPADFIPTPGVAAPPHDEILKYQGPKDNENRHDYVRQMISSSMKSDEGGIQEARKAIEQLPPFSRGDRKTARAGNDQGIRHLKAGQFSEAINVLERAHQADLGDIEIVNNLGYAYFMHGDLETAEQNLLTTLSLEPGRAAAWTNLGQTYAKKGDEQSATGCFANAYRFSKNRLKTRDFLIRLTKEVDSAALKNSVGRQLDLLKSTSWS